VSLVEIATLPERVARLQSALDRVGVPLDVRQGGELSPPDVYRVGGDELEAIAHGPHGRRWLLLEAPLTTAPPGLYPAAKSLRARGYDVLVGHPERSPAFSLEELGEHVRRGSVLQLNASSLVGVHGLRPQRVAIEVARSGLPFVLASDAHSPDRPPLLSAGARVLADVGIAPEVIHSAVDTGPGRLLSDGLAALASPDSAARAA
jgi:protein-tyrosine phosphatase